MQPAGPAIHPPVLLVHGATFGSALFDLPVSGYSLMQELARGGCFVYAVDIRGYGASNRNGVMNSPPAAHPPFSRARHAVEDIGVAVSEIQRRQRVQAIDLVGFSWGTITAGWYASGHVAEIRRLVLYAPLFAEKNMMWLDRIGDPADRNRLAGHFGAYRLITMADVIARWDSDAPGKAADVREDGVVESLFEAAARLDALAGSHQPPAFRCPNGAFADLIEVFNGRPLYDPGTIAAPVLLVRGEVRYHFDGVRYATAGSGDWIGGKILSGNTRWFSFPLYREESHEPVPGDHGLSGDGLRERWRSRQQRSVSPAGRKS